MTRPRGTADDFLARLARTVEGLVRAARTPVQIPFVRADAATNVTVTSTSFVDAWVTVVVSCSAIVIGFRTTGDGTAEVRVVDQDDTVLTQPDGTDWVVGPASGAQQFQSPPLLVPAGTTSIRVQARSVSAATQTVGVLYAQATAGSWA